jgi:hypothetical protein
MRPIFFLIVSIYLILLSCKSARTSKANVTSGNINSTSSLAMRQQFDTSEYHNRQVAIIKQQIWENLNRVAGTKRDYTTNVRLRIANENEIDADCSLLFPASSWEIATPVVEDYKAVLRNTNTNFFEVVYKLITDSRVLASEIKFTGLWRPWGGSHIHPDGRGIDIGTIRSSMGSGVIFNSATSASENEFGRNVRTALTTNFPFINQYLSPWFICDPSSSCVVNNGQSRLERTHKDHLHITLNR